TTQLSRRGRLQQRDAVRNQDGGPGQVQRLDTHHVLDWDGPNLSQVVRGLEGPGVAVSGRIVPFQPRSGLRPTHPNGGPPCASTPSPTDSPPASICTQERCTSAPSPSGARSSSTRTSPPLPPPSSRPLPSSATGWSSAANACSP